jgi:hypothetical protein
MTHADTVPVSYRIWARMACCPAVGPSWNVRVKVLAPLLGQSFDVDVPMSRHAGELASSV